MISGLGSAVNFAGVRVIWATLPVDVSEDSSEVSWSPRFPRDVGVDC